MTIDPQPPPRSGSLRSDLLAYITTLEVSTASYDTSKDTLKYHKGLFSFSPFYLSLGGYMSATWPVDF
jgi:hypothetical protein